MKLLWMCNIILPEIAKTLHQPINHTGGWLVGLSQELCESKKISQMVIVFPQSFSTTLIQGESEHFTYYGFYRDESDLVSCSTERIEVFEDILRKEQPELIHIFGSEFVSTYEMVCAAEREKCLFNTILSIQGLIGECANVYEADLPDYAIRKRSLRDRLKNDGILIQKEMFARRGEYEKKAIAKVSHVIGRTAWDKACVLSYNPNVHYHHCGETLRNSFSKLNWSYDECTKHTIFLSQGYYPIKGLHKMIEAMPMLLDKFPDTKIRVTGRDILHLSLKERLKLNSYQTYLRKRIYQLGLENKISFLGSLNEGLMGQEYLHAHVFVSPSVIENSSNSIGEAQSVGVPVVASDVGGTSSIVTDGEDGLLYPFEDVQKLSNCILQLFEMKETAETFGQNAKKKAKLLYDGKRNNETLLEIYASVLNV